MEEKRKKKIIKISVLVGILLLLLIGLTYAFTNPILTGTKKQILTSGTLNLELQEDENNLTIQDAMPMYDEVGMIQAAFTFRLINKSPVDTDYILKLEKIIVENPLDPSIVKYGLTKDEEVKIDFVSNIIEDTIDIGTIKGKQTIEYSLRLWIDANVENLNDIQQRRLSYKLNIEASQSSAVSQVNSIVFDTISENLSDSCKTYNDGVDTFLVGQCQSNYVWYSGKLWRVVLKNNETGAVKMTTDNAMTIIKYNTSDNAAFENSYVDQWLSQEFLPTLHDYEDYLVTDSVWDATTGSTSDPTRPDGTTLVNRTVGLLNAYEYYTTYNIENEEGHVILQLGHLNNHVLWWTITPSSYGTSNVIYVGVAGYMSNNSTVYDFGVRPSVNLKSNIQIVSGNGSRSNPYRLAGDEQETVGGTTLLNTRYSGEYVKFNNELYRIVDVENDLTKITAVDKPTELASNPFHSAEGVVSFANASIKTDLENYYTNSVIAPYKSMIELNRTWYLKTLEGGGTSYKESICATVDANISSRNCEKTSITATASIGLPRVGEMFTSQITRGRREEFWTLTPISASKLWYVEGDTAELGLSVPTGNLGIRPSMYLKSNVRIASNNTGDGTYESPYDIELSS